MQTDAPVQGLMAYCFQADSVSTYSFISFRTTKIIPSQAVARAAAAAARILSTILLCDANKSPVSTIYSTVFVPFSTPPSFFSLHPAAFFPTPLLFFHLTQKWYPADDGFYSKLIAGEVALQSS